MFVLIEYTIAYTNACGLVTCPIQHPMLNPLSRPPSTGKDKPRIYAADGDTKNPLLPVPLVEPNALWNLREPLCVNGVFRDVVFSGASFFN